jgi:hypothetical protein
MAGWDPDALTCPPKRQKVINQTMNGSQLGIYDVSFDMTSQGKMMDLMCSY